MTYVVTDADNNYVSACGSTASGYQTIPATFQVGDVTLTVTGIGYYTSLNNAGSTTTTTWDNVGTLSILSSTNLTTIDNPNFGSSLQNFNLSPYVTTIKPFTLATSLPKFTLVSGSNYFEVDDYGALYTKGKKALIAVPSTYGSSSSGTSTTFTIPDGVEEIYPGAIRSTYITKLVIPASVKTIPNTWPSILPQATGLQEIEVASGNTTFRSEDGLLIRSSDNALVFYPAGKGETTFTVPDDVTKVLSNSIIYNNTLTTVDLNKVTTMEGSECIYECDNLQTVKIGASMTTIDEGAISFNESLSTFEVASDNEYFSVGSSKSGIIKGALYNYDKTTLLFVPPAYTSSKNYETVGSPTTRIAKEAFVCSQLKSIHIGKAVNEIGESPFRMCNNLSNVQFDNQSTLKVVPTWMFYDCPELGNITFPDAVETVSKNAIVNCEGMSYINFYSTSNLTTIEDSAFVNLPNVTGVYLNGSNLTTIGADAFNKLTSLGSITIPQTVTTLGDNAFRGCSSLKTVNWGSNPQITTIGAGTFADCGLTSFEIPSSVTTIKSEAFRNCTALTDVSLSANVSSVDARAFKGCTNLNNFTVDSGNAYYSAVNGYLLDKDKTSLVVFPPAKAHENMTLLPPSITSIGDYAFYECTNLTNVTIPQKVTKIGQRAFGLCDNLNHVTFLCESMISPSNIPYTDNNTVAFDNGTNRSDKYNAFSHITISVRKSLLSTYQASSYYTQFKGGASGIDPSFNVAHTGDATSNDGDEYIAVSDNAAMLLSTAANVCTYVVGTSVSHGGSTLNVAAVGDYAFQNAPSTIDEVVLRDDVDYIGAMAFVTSTSTSGSTVKPTGSTIKDIVFCGTPSFQLSSQAFELGDDYHEFYTGQKIYVRKSQVDAFKEVLPTYAQTMVDYQIPGATISNKYGTFSREFDTDLNAYYTDNSSGKLAAFVGMITDILEGGGDYGTATYHIRMNSVDEYTGKTGDEAYVPANTGVLIKVMDDDATATPSGFWYAIGETDQGTYDDATASAISGKNVMQPVTVSASGDIYDTSAGSQYVMQRGVFRKVNQSYSMPIHKAYLQVSGTNGAKVSLVFDEDSEATGISAVNADPATDGSANAPVYNLQGQRISNPQHGIYIRGGKKIIVK